MSASNALQEVELLDFKNLKEDSEQEPTDQSEENSSSKAEDGAKAAVHLEKEFSFLHMIGFVVGEIIGSGIFITPNVVLKYAGSFGLSLTVWVLGALLAILGSLCFMELGTFLKKSGSLYAYILEAYSFKKRNSKVEFLGSQMAFLTAWTSLIVIRPAAVAIITLSCGRYLTRPFYIECDVPIHVVKLFALAAITLMVIVQCYSVRLTLRMITVLTIAKILACIFVILTGVVYLVTGGDFSEDAKQPFVGSTHSPSDISLALYGVLWAYDGWTALNNSVEEQKNMEKNLPRALIIGVSIVAICYLLINLAFFAVLSYDEILSAEAVALLFADKILGKAGVAIVSLMVAMSAFGAANGSLFAGARVNYIAARDGLLPDVLSGIHISLKTPIPATLVMAPIAVVLVIIGNIEDLIDGGSAALWIFYLLSFLGLLIMRVTHRREPRPFKVWFIVPVVMVVVSIFLIVLPIVQKPIPSLATFFFISLGIPLYIFFAMEKPRRLRPKLFDRISEHVSRFTNNLLNTQTERYQ